MGDDVSVAARAVLERVDEIGWEGLASWVVPEAVESVRPAAYEREFEVGIPELWAGFIARENAARAAGHTCATNEPGLWADATAGWEHDDRL